MHVPPGPPADLSALVHVLSLVARAPRRTEPRPGDIEGDYDAWFDGGAMSHDTDFNRFHFADGAEAWLGTSSSRLHGGVRLASGEVVTFEQQAARVAGDACVICGHPIVPGATHVLTPRGPAHVACV